MKQEIFAAEILWDGSRQVTGFDSAKIKVLLTNLRNNYEEAFILSEGHRLLFVVSGFSRIPLVDAVLKIVPYVESLEIKVGESAVALVLEIASGKRWKDMTSKQVRHELSKAASLSIEANCMGEVFSNLFLRAWDENAKSYDSYSQLDNLIKNPVFTTFDFHEYSLN